MNCKKAEGLILKKSANKKLNTHISECPKCYILKQNYDSLINALNQDYDYPLDSSQIMQSIHSLNRQIPQSSIRALSYSHRFLAAAATFILFTFIALFYFYIHFNIKRISSNNLKENNYYQLCIKNTPEGILLTWKNSKKSKYTIYRSTNPKDFSNAKKIIIKGNKYLDKEANNYPIVFYKIL